MLKIPKTLPVRTRVPLAGWAVAGFVTLFALASSLLHAVAPGDHAMARAEQGRAECPLPPGQSEPRDP